MILSLVWCSSSLADVSDYPCKRGGKCFDERFRIHTCFHLASELSGASARQKRSGDKESPRKMPLLMLTNIDYKLKIL